MEIDGIKKGIKIVLTFLAVWLGVRYLFGIALPFLLGALVAALAEPGVRFLQQRFRFRRGPASAVAVTLTFVMLVTILWLLMALGYRELANLAVLLPEAARTVTEGAQRLQLWVLGLVRRAPDGLAYALEQMVTGLFTGGGTLLADLFSGLLGGAGKLVSGLSGGLLTLGIGVLSAYMISGQLPGLRNRVEGWAWRKRLEPVGRRLKAALGGWLKAQLKLMAVTFCIVTGGFLLLRVEGAVLWAALTAVVDAVPLLGTGTVLIPWTLVCLLQGDLVRAVGLVGIYLAAMLTRSALEPRLVGRQLGMNPLVTLAALYAGFRIWGVWGMFLAPILTITVIQIASAGGEDLPNGGDVVE